jgi:hypothetical protein
VTIYYIIHIYKSQSAWPDLDSQKLKTSFLIMQEFQPAQIVKYVNYVNLTRNCVRIPVASGLNFITLKFMQILFP